MHSGATTLKKIDIFTIKTCLFRDVEDENGAVNATRWKQLLAYFDADCPVQDERFAEIAIYFHGKYFPPTRQTTESMRAIAHLWAKTVLVLILAKHTTDPAQLLPRFKVIKDKLFKKVAKFHCFDAGVLLVQEFLSLASVEPPHVFYKQESSCAVELMQADKARLNSMLDNASQLAQTGNLYDHTLQAIEMLIKIIQGQYSSELNDYQPRIYSIIAALSQRTTKSIDRLLETDRSYPKRLNDWRQLSSQLPQIPLCFLESHHFLKVTQEHQALLAYWQNHPKRYSLVPENILRTTLMFSMFFLAMLCEFMHMDIVVTNTSRGMLSRLWLYTILATALTLGTYLLTRLVFNQWPHPGALSEPLELRIKALIEAKLKATPESCSQETQQVMALTPACIPLIAKIRPAKDIELVKQALTNFSRFIDDPLYRMPMTQVIAYGTELLQLSSDAPQLAALRTRFSQQVKEKIAKILSNTKSQRHYDCCNLSWLQESLGVLEKLPPALQEIQQLQTLQSYHQELTRYYQRHPTRLDIMKFITNIGFKGLKNLVLFHLSGLAVIAAYVMLNRDTQNINSNHVASILLVLSLPALTNAYFSAKKAATIPREAPNALPDWFATRTLQLATPPPAALIQLPFVSRSSEKGARPAASHAAPKP